jgi:hypothetical protein
MMGSLGLETQQHRLKSGAQTGIRAPGYFSSEKAEGEWRGLYGCRAGELA